MERDGLVRREPDARDGRVVWLHPTAAGTKLLHAGRRRRVAALEADLAGLAAAERDTLAEAADILERVLDAAAAGKKDALAKNRRMIATAGKGRRR